MIREDRLARLGEITVLHGSHPAPADPERPAGCLLELSGWLAGETWGDHPGCVCPVLAAAGRRLNDVITSNAERTAHLRELAPLLVGSATGDREVERGRAYAIVDWSLRERLPLVLAALGRPASEAASLRALAPITDCRSALAAREVCLAIRSAAYAAYAASASAVVAACAYAAAAAASDAAAAAACAYAATPTPPPTPPPPTPPPAPTPTPPPRRLRLRRRRLRRRRLRLRRLRRRAASYAAACAYAAAADADAASAYARARARAAPLPATLASFAALTRRLLGGAS